jgi:hypothetical protein
MSTRSVIQVSGIRETHNSTMAVDHASFEAFEGEIFRDRAKRRGKKTTMECIEGLRWPDDQAQAGVSCPSSSFHACVSSGAGQSLGSWPQIMSQSRHHGAEIGTRRTALVVHYQLCQTTNRGIEAGLNSWLK